MTDRTGYDERFDDLARVAYRVGYRVLGDREDAADVAQEAMARAYERWKKIEPYADACGRTRRDQPRTRPLAQAAPARRGR